MNYTVKEVAKKLRVSGAHVYELIKRGELKKVERIGRVIRISSKDLNNIRCRDYFQCDHSKVQVFETSLGKIRMIKNDSKYVLVDLTKALGVKDSYSIVKAIDTKYVSKINTDEARGFGFFSNQFGILLISYEGIKEYSTKSRNQSKVETLLKELKVTHEDEIQQTIDFNKEEKSNQNSLSIFEGHKVEIIEVNGEKLFELYSTGMALGYETVSKGIKYPHKIRIDKTIKNADIKPVVHSVQPYLTEEMLYDFMLETKTDKVKPFRKWVTGTVLPSINKTGGYVANTPKFTNSYFNNFSKELRKEMEVELSSKAYSLYEEKEKLDKRVLESIRLLEELQGTLR
jgi:excisionase family DNA binding protein